jgi:hypothetical protein
MQNLVDVLVNRVQSNPTVNDASRVGINDRIKTASSSLEIKLLLRKVRAFKKAHPATIRKCEKSAQQRLQFLYGNISA